MGVIASGNKTQHSSSVMLYSVLYRSSLNFSPYFCVSACVCACSESIIKYLARRLGFLNIEARVPICGHYNFLRQSEQFLTQILLTTVCAAASVRKWTKWLLVLRANQERIIVIGGGEELWAHGTCISNGDKRKK